MTIIIGYVPSEQGEAALSFAIQEAVLRDTQLLVVNSGKGESFVDGHYAQPEQLASVRQQVEQAGLDWQIRHSVRGLAGAEEVLNAAEETKASMIVIGTRKRSPVGKLLLGSDAQEILTQANCPVVAVKAGYKDSHATP
jgi:nucleotide-binding universal stress UspA family protein